MPEILPQKESPSEGHELPHGQRIRYQRAGTARAQQRQEMTHGQSRPGLAAVRPAVTAGRVQIKHSAELYLPPANRAFCCLLKEMHSKVWEAELALWVVPPDNNNLGTASTAVRTAGKEFYWNMH